MDRVYNFSAGPSMLPLEVLEKAQKELLNYNGCGSSVLEMSHRSKPFEAIVNNAEATLRRIMHIPDEYAVLFLQGGASLQFSMVPMNLTAQGATTAYAVTGQFAKKAWEEGARWGNAVAVTNGKIDNFAAIPAVTPELIPQDAAYLHITGNNTVYGTAYNTLPDTGSVPLVADWSSAILGKVIDVKKHALIYAGAQKNMGPAGLTVVILRKELLERTLDPIVPTMLQYAIHADKGSMYNTPPCFSIYMAGLVFEWVEKNGGVEAMEQRNAARAAALYKALESCDHFRPLAAKKDRSIMNVTFTLDTPEMTAEFLAMAQGRGLTSLKGYRTVGGCRASLYNGMPDEGVAALIDCICAFEIGKRT
ncbi:MAG: 3-phosphoserine/phosphohydroxythreonine transaminase [Oscillospiraceae bacterium]|nr:3-phosphoserine/phosphohydroxythreonine transaminase [Oscillospiraceae bacterium]